MATGWGLLDEKEEQELHKKRLLNVEEKHFKRVTKRLSQVNDIIKKGGAPTQTSASGPQAAPDSAGIRPSSQPDTPIAATASGAPSDSNAQEKLLQDIRRLKEDVTLDFAAFDHSIVRLQFLANANTQERAGYAAKKQRILDDCQAVRDRNAELRIQLEQSRATLAQRKKFDELADKITNNKMLRPRADQFANLTKLEDECRELERESETYAATWKERRDQFSKIMEQAAILQRRIKDEKEEVDRREGMNEDEEKEEGEEDGEASAREGQTPRPGLASGNATPQVESGLTASQIDGSGTPRAESPAGDGLEGLKPRPAALGMLSQAGSRSGSRAATPQPLSARDDIEEGEDVEMDEPKLNGMPQITVDGPGDKMEVDGA